MRGSQTEETHRPQSGDVRRIPRNIVSSSVPRHATEADELCKNGDRQRHSENRVPLWDPRMARKYLVEASSLAQADELAILSPGVKVASSSA
jgi:hypothetical protein